MLRLNGKKLDVTLFPDQTSQVWQLSEYDLQESCRSAFIEWSFSHEGEFLHLAQLKTLLDHYEISADLYIDYLPYARQDKDVSNASTFALTTFAALLNSLKFDNIQITDPHSNRAIELINNSSAYYPGTQVSKVLEITKGDIVCYPDKGACDKYISMYQHHFMYGEKQRNQLTGYIENYELIGDPSNKSVLIVDDICDGGMTFILLTRQLLEAGAKEVNLFVTHGLFSKGLGCLKEAGINKIFTIDGEVSEVQNNIAYRTL